MIRTRALLLSAATAGAALALFCGVALAATVRCEKTLECRGTRGNDTMIGYGLWLWNDPSGGGEYPEHQSMYGLAGNDTLKGRGGPDNLYGGEGDDRLIGEDFYDNLIGGKGDDRLAAGGEEADNFVFSGRWGNDTVYLPEGAPRSEWGGGSLSFDGYFSISEVGADLRVDLEPGRGPEATDGKNTVELANPGLIGRVEGGSGDDTIKGDREGNNGLIGGGGDDAIEGRGGGDSVYGLKGDDSLIGGDGDDHLALNYGRTSAPLDEMDTAKGGAGDDGIWAHDGARDVVDCGEGNDEVLFDEGLDKVASNCEARDPR